jgi:hypothetical protein
LSSSATHPFYLITYSISQNNRKCKRKFENINPVFCVVKRYDPKKKITLCVVKRYDPKKKITNRYGIIKVEVLWSGAKRNGKGLQLSALAESFSRSN